MSPIVQILSSRPSYIYPFEVSLMVSNPLGWAARQERAFVSVLARSALGSSKSRCMLRPSSVAGEGLDVPCVARGSHDPLPSPVFM